MENKNKVYMVVDYQGRCWNVEAENIVEAANKITETVSPKEIFQIVDIPG